MRRTLGLSPAEKLQELGVYPAHSGELADIPQSGDKPGPGEVILSEEWLSDDDLAEHFSADTDLSAALPGARSHAKRLDIDPRVLVFEQVPEPRNSTGMVRRMRDGTWIMDCRDGPAALVFQHDGEQIVLWGEDGGVRLFAVRSTSA